MKKKILCLLVCMLFLTAALLGCGNGDTDKTATEKDPVKLTVSAAASLTDASKELKELYTKKNSHVTIDYSYGSSGALQKQIEEGAPSDLFISAGVKQMDALEEKDLIDKNSRYDLLNNELVLIAKEDSKLKDFKGLAEKEVTTMSIGQPDSVPAGKYAKEALTSLDLWSKVESKIVYANNVRQVLTYVETGNVDAGLVYRSDVIGAGKTVKVIAAAPEDSHKPIIYPMAILKSSKNKEETAKFADFLKGKEAAKIFEKYGFQPIKK